MAKDINDSIPVVNEQQKSVYENMEQHISKTLLQEYVQVIKSIENRQKIKVLDIGGGSGYFALSLKKYFSEKNCECDITVIDTMKYDTWQTFSNQINFIEKSVDELFNIFTENTFDIIFANRVFHHFVRSTWKKTYSGMSNIMAQIATIIRPDGYFCITDHFFDGVIFDKITSKIIYTVSSSKFKPVMAICKKVGVESSGIGVCFLSQKMWESLLSNNDFVIEYMKETEHSRIKKWYIKALLLNKKSKMDNIIIAKRK